MHINLSAMFYAYFDHHRQVHTFYLKLTQARALRDTNLANLSTNNKSCLRD